MKADINKAYDQGYLVAIKDLRETIKFLSEQYQKDIPINQLKNELREMQERYIGFANATITEI